MRLELADWRGLLRPGDVLVALGGLLVCGYALLALWQGGVPDGAVIRAGGKVVARVDLARERTIEVPGPPGVTLIEIRPGRASPPIRDRASTAFARAGSPRPARWRSAHPTR